jgi:hypothetical protein
MKSYQKHSFFWVTLLFFLLALAAHWYFGWMSYVQEQQALLLPVQTDEFNIRMLRDIFGNWQSDFLQLLWLVAGLSFLYHLGSPLSKEGRERLEEKLDYVLKAAYSDADELIGNLDKKYPRK